VLNSALARYRREWSFAIHRAKQTVLSDWQMAEAAPPPLGESIDRVLHEALKRLPKSDSWLITQLFWEGKSEASLGKCLGISQQGVSRRKGSILKTLHRLIDELTENLEDEL
jgi:DNA-directed RNA polymerase specialized sigma subunit